MSPPNFKSKSVGAKTRRNSDATETFSLHIHPVIEQEEMEEVATPIEPLSSTCIKKKTSEKVRRNSDSAGEFALAVMPVMEEDDTEPDSLSHTEENCE